LRPRQGNGAASLARGCVAQFTALRGGNRTSVEWKNPHTWFYLDVKDAGGNVTNWGLELAPNLLVRNGRTKLSRAIVI